ncbi:MAG: polymerase beta domain protein region protein [Candidatus Roizmanbacteria bacterium GW2011_GWA2_37_7]|uniref:Polymerase beta domain protein region protein n=1 Tax=Candidatus Roizmanbacteria bacterium GW2011_GWA2_37_7 TaxID=1618481 RepID=A0A0G0JIU3_9BACT|nr:MAG: polymerase beta domain protein region protein [Candidatus Roizmanbacteria bacterium GW2011_GWA2_37_7]
MNLKILKQIELIGKSHNLDFVILHGSKVTRKTINPQSDTDIAVYRNGGIDFEEELSLTGEFIQIFGDSVDVKTLNKKNPLFLYEVIRDGKLLYGNRDAYNNFVIYIQKKYIDTNQLRFAMRGILQKKQKILNTLYA